MSETPDDALEARLQALLHRIDEVEAPPAPDFAARAMASDDVAPDTVAPVVPLEPRRRARPSRSLLTAAVGAAAALVVGVAVVEALPHSASSGSSSTVAGAAEGDSGATATDGSAAAPQADDGTSPTADVGRTGPVPLSASSATASPLATLGGETVADGRAATTSDVAAAVADLEAQLGAAPYDTIFSGAVVRADPVHVEVHLTTFDDAVLATVSSRLPAGTAVTYVQSYFSLSSCRATLAQVQAGLPSLAEGGATLGDPRCDLTGRVALTAGGTPTGEQRSRLRSQYGETVVLVDATGRAV